MKHKLVTAVAGVMLCAALLGGCGAQGGADMKGERTPTDEQLMSSGYTFDSDYSDYVSDTPGLINPFIVGVDQDKFENEVLYPVPSSGIVIDAAEYGVTADDGKDDSAALQRAFAAAAAEDEDSVKIVRLPAGRIDVIEGGNGIDYGYGLVLEGLKNVVIDGNGADIMLSCFLGMSGFYVKNCENIQFNNFTVDYTNPPYMMGKVTSFDRASKTIEVLVNEGYPIDTNAPVIQYVEYDPISKTPRAPGNYLYINESGRSIESSEYIRNEDGSYTVRLKATSDTYLEDTMINTPVALGVTFYVAQLFMVEDCKDVYFETVTAYTAWGMTVRAYNNENLYFNRFLNICKPGTDRLFTASADILHLKNTAGEIKITNCLLENSHDDAINIGGHMLQVYSVNAETGEVAAAYASGMWGTFRPEIGEKFELSDSSDLNAIATLTVKSVRYNGENYLLTFEETSLDPSDENYVDLSKITTSSRLSSLTKAPKVEIRNNVIRNKRNRGILIQSRDVVVENNLFSNIVHGAIMLIADDVQFHESLAPKNVVIRNNKFLRNSIGTQYGDIDAFVWTSDGNGALGAVSDIEISNNFFGESYNAAISLRRVADFNIEGNTFYRPGTKNVVVESNTALYVEKSDGINVEKNRCVSDSDTDFKSITVNGQLSSTALTLTDNEGMELDEGAVIEALEVARSQAGTIAIDGDLSDWDGIESAVTFVGATNGAANIGVDKVDPSSFSAEAKIAATDEGLYFMFDVKDDRIEFTPSWWNGDFAEIFITENLTSLELLDSFATLYPDSDWAQIYVANNTLGIEASRSSSLFVNGASQIAYSGTVGTDGYSGELFIPFALMPKIEAALSEGKEISFSMTFGDCDDPSNVTIVRVSTVNYPLEENKMTPANMGKLKIV